ncbi:hypothetical protein PMIN02_003115 [Paraphaeosphaeria minitans]
MAPSILLPAGLPPGYPPGEEDQDRAMEASWLQVLDDFQDSPGYQLLFSDGGSKPPRPNKGNPVTSAPASNQHAHERSEASSPNSDTTIKLGDVLESGGIACTPTRPEPQPDRSTSPVEKTECTLVPQPRPHALVFDPAPRPVSVAAQSLPGTPQKNRIASRTAVSTPRSYAAALCSIPESDFESSSSDAVGVSEMASPLKNPPVGDTMGRFHLASPAQTTPPARAPHHLRRTSSKFAFVPVLPSPLGPRQYTNDLSSDVSGLVTPVPKTAPSPTTRSARRASINATASAPGSAVPCAWTRSTPGLGIYAPFDTSPASDPFVERSIPGPPTSVGFAPIPSSTQVPNTPAGFTPLGPKPGTPTTRHFARPSANADALRHPVTGLYPLQTPVSFPLPSLAANLGVTAPPVSPTRFAARMEWFDRNSTRMVATGRAFALAKEKYDNSGQPADCTAMLAAQKAMLEAWDGDALQLERRELTMPAGMHALRAEHAQDGMGGEEGKILGGDMAILERISANMQGWEGQGAPADELDEADG